MNLEAKNVAELALECGEIGVDRFARDGSRLRFGLGGAAFGPAGAAFRLAYRPTLGNDVAGQRFRVGRSRNRPRVTHTDIASQQRLAHELWQIEQAQQIGNVAS